MSDYYQSIGYYRDGGSFWNVMIEDKIYAGYRAYDFMDIEAGLSISDVEISETYKNLTGDVIWSKRKVDAQVLYASALLRPEYGYGHMLYFKFGGHFSQLEVTKSVTGSPSNLASIAAGDHMQEDGSSTGFGTLFGVGLDFNVGKIGAIRLERNRLFRIGGTSHIKDALNIGFHANF